jgi:hypothetical protein
MRIAIISYALLEDENMPYKKSVGKSLIGYLIGILVALFVIIGLSVNAAAVVVETPPEEGTSENAIQKPEWKIGDSWSMGYSEDLSDYEDEIKSALSLLEGNIKTLSLDGEMGLYQSAEVKDDDVELLIGETTYTCYDVYYEQYLGMVYRVNYDFEISIPDYEESYDSYEEEFYYDEGNYSISNVVTSPEETSSMSMKASMYIWIRSDITGHIYYTESELAIAKGTFDVSMEFDMNMDMTMVTETEGTISMSMNYKLENMAAKFDVEYNPPLDIFDFPIEPNEYWSASSSVTQTLKSISGIGSYDMTMKSPESPQEFTMSDDFNLGEEITTPDVYGPTQVTYYFYYSGTDSVTMANGINEECHIIEPDEDYWYRDYNYTYYDNYYDESSYSSSSSYMPGVPIDPYGSSELFDMDAENMENPVETIANAENYYSEDEGNIISYKPSSDSSNLAYSTVPFSTSEEAASVSPKTYAEVNEFKSTKRDEMKTNYPKPAGAGEKSNDDMTWTFLIIAVIAGFLVFLILIIAIHVSKKKRLQKGYPHDPGQPYPSYPPTQVPRTDHAQGNSYASPKMEPYPSSSAHERGYPQQRTYNQQSQYDPYYDPNSPRERYQQQDNYYNENRDRYYSKNEQERY